MRPVVTDTGNTVIFVTHLYELAHRLYQQHAGTTLFLRPDRGADSNRTFRIAVGEPLPTSYGEDLYRRTFGTGPPAAAASPGSESTRHDDAT